MTKRTLLLLIILSSYFLLSPKKVFAECGATTIEDGVTQCVNSSNNLIMPYWICERDSNICCFAKSECQAVFPVENITEDPSSQFFDALNPLKIEGDATISADLSTPGGIVSRLLQFLFPIAGLILFVMLVWGGFEILSKSTQGTKGMEAGKNRITTAIVGFLLLFATYWMAQIIEVIFGIVTV